MRRRLRLPQAAFLLRTDAVQCVTICASIHRLTRAHQLLALVYKSVKKMRMQLNPEGKQKLVRTTHVCMLNVVCKLEGVAEGCM